MSTIGITAALNNLGSAAIQPMWPFILSRLPKVSMRKFLIFVFLIAIGLSIGLLISPLASSWILVFYVLIGTFQLSPNSLLNELGMEYINRGVKLNFGAARATGSAWYAVASMLLGFAVERFNFRVLPIANLIFVMITITALIFIPEPDSFTKKDTQHSANETAAVVPSSDVVSFIRGNLPFLVLFIAAVLFFISHCFVNYYLPNIAGQFGGGADSVGILIALAAVVELIPMFFYTRVNRKISTEKLILFSGIGFIIKAICTMCANSLFTLEIAQSLQIIAYPVFTVATVYYVNKLVEEKYSVLAQGLIFGAQEFGYTVASLIGGIILEDYSVKMLLQINTGFAILGFITLAISVFLAGRQKARRQTAV